MDAIKFFGCRYTPFSDTFEVKAPFLTTADSLTVERIGGLLRQGKSVALTGEPGLGKSMLLKAVISELDTKVFKPVLIPFGGNKPVQILKEICEKMDIDTSGRVSLLNRLRQAFKRSQDTPFPVLVIDDAHELESKSFTDICSLLHDPYSRTAAASVIFCGHESLRRKLELNIFKAIRTRLAFLFEMEPLTHEDVADFIRFRLEAAEASKNIFHKDAIELIAMDSKGNRRQIMMDAGIYMDEAVTRKEKVVTADLIHTFQKQQMKAA